MGVGWGRWVGSGSPYRAVSSRCSIKRFVTTGERGDFIASPSSCS